MYKNKKVRMSEMLEEMKDTNGDEAVQIMERLLVTLAKDTKHQRLAEDILVAFAHARQRATSPTDPPTRENRHGCDNTRTYYLVRQIKDQVEKLQYFNAMGWCNRLQLELMQQFGRVLDNTRPNIR